MKVIIQTTIVLFLVFIWKLLDQAGYLSGELKAHISGLVIGATAGGVLMLLWLASAAEDDDETPEKPRTQKKAAKINEKEKTTRA